MSYDEDALKKELLRDEGKRLMPYKDSLGYWTVGVGHLLVGDELKKFVDQETGKPRRALTEAECGDLLMGDIIDAENKLNRILPGWRALDDVRQRALLNLAFNLGYKLKEFRRFLNAVQREDWGSAGNSLRASLWWKQVKTRGPRIVYMIKTGKPWRAARGPKGGSDAA